MREIPNCKICKLKCYGCSSYASCGIRQGLYNHKIEECTSMASKYYLFNDYLDSFNMQLCRFQEECKSVVEAWLYDCN